MIHALIDGVTTRRIVGFECGTRAQFDARHGGDPLWVFLDYSTINYRIRTSEFLDNPLSFFIDKRGLVQKRLDPKQRKDFVYLTDTDAYLTDSDGTYLKEPQFPPINVNISDPDGSPLVEDGSQIIEKF